MKKVLAQFPDWEFEIDEVSAGVYQAVGRNKSGDVISFAATDPDEAFQACLAKIETDCGAGLR